MSAPTTHDPLVVNTKDGVCWTRRTVTPGGISLYAPESVRTCPKFVMATLAELAEHGIVGSAHVLPMPVGPEPRTLSADPRIELIRRERTHCEAAQFESEDDRQPHVWGPSQYPKREMCQRCTVTREWAEDPEATDVVLLAEVDRLRARVVELESERHSTNEALDDAVQDLRARPNFFQPGRTYAARAGWPGGQERFRFICESVTNDPETGDPRALGQHGRRNGAGEWVWAPDARTHDDWSAWTDITDEAPRDEQDVTPQVRKLRSLLAGQRAQAGEPS